MRPKDSLKKRLRLESELKSWPPSRRPCVSKPRRKRRPLSWMHLRKTRPGKKLRLKPRLKRPKEH